MNTNTTNTASSRAHAFRYSLKRVEVLLTDKPDQPFEATYYFSIKIPCTCGALSVMDMSVCVIEDDIAESEFDHTNNLCGCAYAHSHYNDIKLLVHTTLDGHALKNMAAIIGCPIELVYVEQ